MLAVVLVFVAMVVVVVMFVAAGAQFVPTRRQLVETAPFERTRRLKKGVVERERAFEIESAEAEHAFERYIGVAAVNHRSGGTDAAHSPPDALERGRVHQVDFIEQDDVGKGYLLEGDRAARQLLFDVVRVDQRHDRVERVVLLEFLVDKKRLRYRSRISQPGGLYQHRVEAIAAFAQLAKNADQIAAHGAADAAVAGLEDLLVGADHQLLVDSDLAEFVLDHGDALAMVLGQDAIDQCGLAGAEKAGEHRDRYARRHAVSRNFLSSSCAPGSLSAVSSSHQPHR